MNNSIRSVHSPNSYNLEPAGRATQLDKIYVGFVKDTDDQQRMGRLRVWIPELGGDPNDTSQWFTMNYASPFAGATNPYTLTPGKTWTDTQRSYGFWFVPPNLENEVLCCFINGDPGRGIWFGCLFQQYMNHMIPGIAGTPESKQLPVAEYNKLDPTYNSRNPTRPLYTPLSEALITQGLSEDPIRGTTTATVRSNEAVNSYSGILTPGGTQFVFSDEAGDRYVRLRTQSGTQVLLNDSQGMIYLNTRDGANWMELSADGRVTVFSAASISMRCNGTMNLRADGDIRMEAGRSIYMKARGEVGTRPIQGTAASQSGQIQTARTTNTAQVPAIGVNDASTTIKVPSTAITGTFVQGMIISGIPWANPITNTAPPVQSGPSPGYPSDMTQPEIENIIREEATLRGIDPEVAVAVYRSEGAGSYQSLVPRTGAGSYNGREASYGPYQLYTGGGLGNTYETTTGRNLLTDNTKDGITNQIRFALNQAATSGWGQWYGAANAGISDFQGLNGARPVNNVNTTPNPYNSQPVDVATPPNQLAGSGQPAVVVGDTIALGTGPELAKLREGVVTSASVGATASAILSAIKNNSSVSNAQWAVVSAGSYDTVTTNEGRGQLTSNLTNIRSILNAQNYTWILPKDSVKRDVVYGFARGKGDNVVDIGASTDGVTPKNYTETASNVNETISTQLKPPSNTPNTNSTAALNNPTTGVTLSSVTVDGDFTYLNVSFPPGNQSNASNSSVITGTLQNPTDNSEQPTTNYNSTDGGMIMINSARDMHLYANGDMYQTSDGRTARSAKGNMFDYSYGSYDQGAGGYMTMQSNGVMSLGTTANMILQGAKVDINGPSAAGALAAPLAKQPIDGFLQDNDVLGPGQFRFVMRNTILSALPYHEPYAGHGGSTRGTNGYVEIGPVVDQSGRSIPSGAATSGAERPLDLLGTPNTTSAPGFYAGTGYDSKGIPQYEYRGPPDGTQVAASTLSLSPAGVYFIVGEEGKEREVYLDVGGKPTIGYGHLLLPDEVAGNYVRIQGQNRPLNQGPLTDAEIDALFRTDAVERENYIRKVKVPISQTQFDMLFSLVYNCGWSRDVFSKLNAGDYNVSREWLSHNTVKGQFNQALFNRRQREYANFSNGGTIDPATGRYS